MCTRDQCILHIKSNLLGYALEQAGLDAVGHDLGLSLSCCCCTVAASILCFLEAQDVCAWMNGV